MDVYATGPFLKKWFVPENTVIEHEADDGWISEVLLRGEGWTGKRIYEHVINVPYTEFRKIAYFLPNFEELPILWSQWCYLGRPVEFVVRSMEWPRENIAIDTSGYDYARYRAVAEFRTRLSGRVQL